MEKAKNDLTIEQKELLETFAQLDKTGKIIIQIEIYKYLDRMKKRPRK